MRLLRMSALLQHLPVSGCKLSVVLRHSHFCKEAFVLTGHIGCLQEFLDVADRVRYASGFATAPCLQKVAAPLDAAFGGCGRLFTSPGNFAGDTPTPLAEYDAEFVFGGADATLKQIPFTRVPADTLPV